MRLRIRSRPPRFPNTVHYFMHKRYIDQDDVHRLIRNVVDYYKHYLHNVYLIKSVNFKKIVMSSFFFFVHADITILL
jgi:hypothetical protein